MKMVFHIAKAELRNLFYSPVAWFLAIAFIILFASGYTAQLSLMVRLQAASIEVNPRFQDFGITPLTLALFSSINGALMPVLQKLYLFVPLLTMGLFGREWQMGTMSLLLSSPVKLRQIIGGKYLGMLMYVVMLIACMAILMFAVAFFLRSPDYGLMLSSLLGILMLAAVYIAIGMFVSSLTNYPIVAAMGTFLILLALTSINGLWQKYDILRGITYFFYLPGRTDRMMSGLIASKDLIYYALMVCMFLGFTFVRLKSMGRSRPWYVTTSRIVMIIAVTVFVGHVLSLPATTKYWDLTYGDRNTIHPNTQKVVADLSEPMDVTLYVNLLGNSAIYGFPEMRNEFLECWEKILRFKSDIRFRYVYYYYYENSLDQGGLASNFPGKSIEEMAQQMAKGYKLNFKEFKPYHELKDKVDMEPEGHRLLMELSYKGRKELLRTYNSPNLVGSFPSEENMAAAFKRLADPEGIPVILYTSDNLERNLWNTGEREHHWFASKQNKTSVVNLGFDVDTISLENQEIPANITALVVADPKTSFSDKVYQKIQSYIREGGNIILMGEPGKQEILNPIMKDFGIQMLEGNLVQPSFHEMAHMVKPYYTRDAPKLAGEIELWKVYEQWRGVYFKDSSKVLMPGVAALSNSDSSGINMTALLLTDSNTTWLKKGKLIVDSAEVIFNKQEGDMKGAFPTAIQLTRVVNTKEQKVAIYGDADFISNKRWKGGETINRAVYSWMTGNAYPVYTMPFVMPRDNLFLAQPHSAKAFRIIALWILPSLLLVTALVILVRRKRN